MAALVALALAACGGGTSPAGSTAQSATQPAVALECGAPTVESGEVYAFQVTATGVSCKTANGVAARFQDACADDTLHINKPCAVSGFACKRGEGGPKNAVLVVCSEGSRKIAFAYPQ
jgi:hypothetical protein